MKKKLSFCSSLFIGTLLVFSIILPPLGWAVFSVDSQWQSNFDLLKQEEQWIRAQIPLELRKRYSWQYYLHDLKNSCQGLAEGLIRDEEMTYYQMAIDLAKLKAFWNFVLNGVNVTRARFQQLQDEGTILRGISEQDRLVSMYLNPHLVKIIDGERPYELSSLVPLSQLETDDDHIYRSAYWSASASSLFSIAWQHLISKSGQLVMAKDLFDRYPHELVRKMTFYGNEKLGSSGPTTHFFFFPVDGKYLDFYGVEHENILMTGNQYEGDYLVIIKEDANGKISSPNLVSFTQSRPWDVINRERKFQDYQVPTLTKWFFAKRMKFLAENNATLIGESLQTREKFRLKISSKNVEIFWGQNKIVLPAFNNIVVNAIGDPSISHANKISDMLAVIPDDDRFTNRRKFFITDLAYITRGPDWQERPGAYQYFFLPAGGALHNLSHKVPKDTLFIMEKIKTVWGGETSNIKLVIPLSLETRSF